MKTAISEAIANADAHLSNAGLHDYSAVLRALRDLQQAVRQGAPAVIGYGEITQAAFTHGWNSAMERIYGELERARAVLATLDRSEDDAPPAPKRRVAVMREFFAIRYTDKRFGARSDLVGHPLSQGLYAVVECEGLTDAYTKAHWAIGAGEALGSVEVLRVVEHEPVPVEPDPVFGGPSEYKLTVTGSDKISGIPHWASARLTRYEGHNGGWTVPGFIDVPCKH
ncbi:MAG: hypothetical protein QM750_19865 [Rubrivivax sp.]